MGMTALHLMVMGKTVATEKIVVMERTVARERTVVMERVVVTERTVGVRMAQRTMTMGATTKAEMAPGTMEMKNLNTVA